MLRTLRRLKLLLRLNAVERTMDEEMRAHIELETEERIRGGMSPGEARAAARRDFGGIQRHKELGRDARGTRGVEDLVRDLRYGARMLRRTPAFTITAILTFALGVGAATAIFSVVYGVLLRPLPYRDPERLVALWERDTPRGEAHNVVSLRNFEDWRARSRSFEAMAALVPSPVTLPAHEGPERVDGAEVTPGYFTMLGVLPALGRDLTQADVEAGGSTVVLSDGYWRSRLGGDPNVIGRTIPIGGEPYEIVGVMPGNFEPPAFGWLGNQALWMPLVATPQKYSWGRFLLVVGRLRTGVAVAAAQSELAAIAARIGEERPDNQGWSANIVTLSEQLSGHVRTSLSYVLATVLLLLMLAVTNVGTLVLARTRRRLHEFGLRRAIGASDSRIFRQVLTESLLLGLAGSAVGVVAAFPALRALLALLPPELPRQTSIRIDAFVLTTTAGVTLIAAVAFGALAASRSGGAPSTVLRCGGPQRSTARSGGRTLVVAEVAIGVVVAVLAGLMARSLLELREVDLGFDSANVVMGRIALGGYETEEARRAFVDTLLARLRERGLTATGIVTSRPLGGVGPATTFSRADGSRSAEVAVADARWADAGFFRALGIRVVEGELFGALDGPGRPPRAVITESMARSLWPGESAIGRRMRVTLYGGIDVTIAGVVKDVHLFDPRTAPRPAFFLSAHRFTGEIFDIAVKTDAPPAEVVTTIRHILTGLDPKIPLHRVQTMDALVASTLATDRFLTMLLSAFALLGLALAGVGTYGVFAGEVAARSREIGIRLALGASPAGMVALVLTRALAVALTGVAIGIAGAAAAARSMTPLLFGVRNTDVLSFLVPAVALVLLAIAAAIVPALRASRVSPALVLGEDF